MEGGLDALVDEATARRVETGAPAERRLHVAELAPGDVGVLVVEVRRVAEVHAFTRRDGTPGQLRRVTLADATGEVDLVLWGDEVHMVTAGPLVPGAVLVVRGATVKEGYRGGVELALGAATLQRSPRPEPDRLLGRLVELGPTEVVEAAAGPRFKAIGRLLVPGEGECHITAWNDAIPPLLPCVGEDVEVHARPHPALPGWWDIGEPDAAPGPKD